MTVFNPQKPPIFFDKSGKRWLVSKIIFGLIFFNLTMIGLLTFGYYNSIGSFVRVQSMTSSLVNQIIPAKATATESLATTFSIMSSKNGDNYNQYRINQKHLTYLLCDCYKLENGAITNQVTADIQKVFDYLHYKKTSIDPAIQQNIPIHSLLSLSQEYLDNPKLSDIIKDFSAFYQGKISSQVVLDLVAQNISLDSSNIIKLINLKNQLNKQGVNLSFVTSLNQSVENLINLQQISATLYIQPFKFLPSGELDLSSYTPKNLISIASISSSIPTAIIYPTTHTLQTSFNKEKNTQQLNNFQISNILNSLSQNQRQILFENNRPYLEYETKENATKIKNKLYFSNEWLYYNLNNDFNSMGLDLTKVTSGTNNLSNSTATAFEYLGIKNVTAGKDYLNQNLRFHNLIQNADKSVKNGHIQSIQVSDNKNLNSDTEFTKDYLSKVTIKTLPKEPVLTQNTYNPNQVSLSFEGGPDRYYTPKILDLLKEKNLKANFFVTGDNAAAFPEIIERIVREGHLIGNQTLSYINIEKTDSQTLKREIQKTSEIIEKVSLVKPTYFRTPYNLLKDFGHQWQVPTLTAIQEVGLRDSEAELIVNEVDSQSPELILQILQTNSKNQVSFLGINQVKNPEKYFKVIQNHLNTYPKINTEKKLGLEFVTMEVIDNQDKNPSIDPESYQLKNISIPTVLYRYLKSGKADFTVNYKSINYFVTILNWILLFLSVTGVIRLLSLIFGNLIYYANHKQRKLESSDEFFKPPVSMIIPLFNEEKVIVNTVKASLLANYPEFEVIVVDDGSTDDSLQVLRSNFGSNPRVTILTKPNGGKSQALNYGIEHAKYEIVCCMDADTFFAPDTVAKLIKPLINPRVGGVAGSVQIANDYFYMQANAKKHGFSLNPFKYFHLVNTLQRLEYTTAQIFDKVAYSSLNSIAVVPGPIGAWRKSLIQEVGGYQTDTLAEDTNLTLDIIAKGYIIKYVQDAQCFTEAPENWGQLWKQRVRWTFGTMQALWKNKFMLFNPRYGWIGFLAYPHALFSYLNLAFFPIALAMIGSLMFRYIMQSQDPAFIFTPADMIVLRNVVIAFAVFGIADLAIAAYSLILDKSAGKKWLILFLPLVNTVYKIFMFFVLIESILKIFRGKAVGWGHLIRTGTGAPRLTKVKVIN